MKRALKTATIAVTLAGIAIGPPGNPAEARRLEDRPRVARCAEHHPWTHVGEREGLIWCIAHLFNSPGSPRTAVEVGHCESGSDLQDANLSDARGGTFQHSTSSWPGRWRTWGQRIGVSSSITNVLSQAVVSVRMAISLGTWNSAAGWSWSAWCWS